MKSNLERRSSQMDVFKTATSEKLNLTVENFENATNKKVPYYQKNKKGKDKHYALCPLCGNPILVVNLYKTDYEDITKKSKSLHARHCRYSVKGIAQYNEANYFNCPLHNQNSFGREAVRNDNNYNEYLYKIIQNERATIRRKIRDILGVNFSDKFLDNIIDEYLNNRNYQYEHTNEFNLPYSIIYTSNALSIYNRYIKNNAIGNQLVNAINKNSKYFIVTDDKISKIDSNNYAEIDIQLCHHRKHNNNKWYLTLKLTETANNNTNILLETEIEVESIIL